MTQISKWKKWYLRSLNSYKIEFMNTWVYIRKLFWVMSFKNLFHSETAFLSGKKRRQSQIYHSQTSVNDRCALNIPSRPRNRETLHIIASVLLKAFKGSCQSYTCLMQSWLILRFSINNTRRNEWLSVERTAPFHAISHRYDCVSQKR